MSNGDNPVPLPDEHNKHEWDGSESELVEDDDAAEYEEHHTGIKLSYTLKDKEIYSCLTHGSSYKNKKRRIIHQICILSILAVVFFCNYIFLHLTSSLIWSMVSILTAFIAYGISRYDIKKQSRTLATGKIADVEIFPHAIVVTENGEEWEIALDGTLSFEEHDNMMLIYLNDGRVFIIPIRCIEPDFIADVQAMILAGTVPKKR